MPAKTEYLSSPGQRALKISAGLLGGFLLAIAVHLAIGVFMEDKGPMIMTSTYTTFFLWIFLMIIAFLFRNGWKAWGLYLLGVAICGGIIFLAS